MADVFISYAKADRSLALKLAAMLEAEGWKTWWDTSLIPGDDFRNEIMTELGRARAVIVIWTDASIKSDWVRSEAGRAQGDRKLIPVKLSNLTYKDLPPPFDVLHTENIGEEDKVKAAVVAQLAKPAVELSPWALLGKGLKWELLTWWGIIGGAITLFVAISATLKLADWARVLVDHWKEWTHTFWIWAFSWLGIHLPPVWTPVLSFLLFGSMLTIGQAVQFQSTIRSKATKDERQGKSFQLMSRRAIVCMICTLIAGAVWFYGWGFYIDAILLNRLETGLPPPLMIITITGVFIFVPMCLVVMMFSRDKVHAFVASFLVGIVYVIITLAWNEIEIDTPPGASGAAAVNVGILLMSVVPVMLLSVAPAKAVSRRLIFLALGLLLLIALNELSKLGLELTAPKLQG